MTLLYDPGVLDPSLAAEIYRFDRALEAGDRRSLEEILTNDFIQVPPNPVPKTKREWFTWFDRVVQYDKMQREVIGCRSFADVTVVLSECSPVMRVKGGEPSVHVAFMLEVWINRDGAWRKAVEQFTRGPQQAAGVRTLP